MSEFDNLKPGDMVAVITGHYDHVYIVPVERITKTQVVVNDRKFSRINGYGPRIDKWSGRDRIEYPVTDDHRRFVEREKAREHRQILIARLNKLLTVDVPTDVLEKVVKLLDGNDEGKGEGK